MAQIIPFPEARVHRSSELVEALEKLESIDHLDGSTDPVQCAVRDAMRKWWETELRRLGGVPREQLRKDGLREGA